MNGGEIIASVLERQGVRQLYTLCGGHISPILVAAKRSGVDVVDVRDEASAVFAADATARMTGVPGVAAVTAGPGLTNTITAVKNAQLAQSPVIVIGGATATVLEGRGALQDIDQVALMQPHVKRVFTPRSVRQLVPTLEAAFQTAREGVPGPVFIEAPVDLLYPEATVREWYIDQGGVKKPKNLAGYATRAYLEQHLTRQFWGAPGPAAQAPVIGELLGASARELAKVAGALRQAERPVFVLSSQAVAPAGEVPATVEALGRLGVPVYLAGGARGLLGHQHPLQFRHARSKALKAADLVIVCGFPLDFRLGYGRSISSKAKLVTVNLELDALTKNRRPSLGVHAHPGRFIQQLAHQLGSKGEAEGRWSTWFAELREREQARDADILEQAKAEVEGVNPIDLFTKLEAMLPDDSVLVVDGGDFVATAAYTLRPRRPLSWLDPGVFGTLGVGGGFAVASCAVRPEAEVWLVYGDGSSAYSLAEIDTCVRKGFAPIMLIGNDGSWQQIARDQVDLLGDACGTELLRTAYHTVAEGYGGKGLVLDDPAKISETIREAQAIAKAGKPVVINAMIGKTDFRKGSISI
ncbi:thiamine pyrophosphate-binding protein [Pseudenhygromyxa sp. WMMC2535]|uniref:thiamine pyrophosphate-binding protein n=1 Tax=Pseudenhygromyxa sp. WMMC2535 TaxID=2712867 RepID=UPI001554B574|nr:thiamine pyrophosphate-binding protein [Pseudenhygromyxa sp. WMMC2535]NVB37135.1 thiamine pyrophosphate-binding protein [Pseudenhygromyxa sp. WMMC2535]